MVKKEDNGRAAVGLSSSRSRADVRLEVMWVRNDSGDSVRARRDIRADSSGMDRAIAATFWRNQAY